MSRNRTMLSTLQSLRGDSGGTLYDPFACSGAWRGLEFDDDYAQAVNSHEHHDLKSISERPEELDKGSISPSNSNNLLRKSENSSCELHPDLEVEGGEDFIEKMPDHLLIEILVRVHTSDWIAAACVKKRWAAIFQGDGFWQIALIKRWPGAGSAKRWPGPIGRGSIKRRFTALHVSSSLLSRNHSKSDVDEIAGHVYLYLKEQLELATPPLSYGLLHGTIIDQFLACGKKSEEAHDVASQIWVAVLGNLEETERTFHLLMRIAEEWEVFLPFPYSKSHAVQWRLFERLFTDFRDCLSQFDYFNVLSRAKHKFDLIPPTWLGY
ncbi:hypothetical protein M758_1G006200 [Ceratodon purpureus]|nr:hypothetical protein M758_1G006200 [Ceratodon purpureus]